MRTVTAARLAAGTVLAGASLAAPASSGAWELTVDAPPVLSPAATRLEGVDPAPIAQALQRAGLTLPPVVRVALVPEDDPRARSRPGWIVGQAFPSGDVLIFPARVASYPYDSLDSVLVHEVVHLALFERAIGRPLPRWFHEGVAVSVETGWSTADNLRLLLAAGRGPAIADLTRLFQSAARPETAEAYRLATALVDGLRRRHGAGLPGAIAGRVGEGLPFSRAFRLETGETPEQAASRAWATYRTFAVWVPVLTSGTSVWTLILALAFVAFLIRVRQRARMRRRWVDEDEG
jgi:hypothetical protein